MLNQTSNFIIPAVTFNEKAITCSESTSVINRKKK